MSDSNWLKAFISGMILGGFLLFVSLQLYPSGIQSQTIEEKACSEQQKRDAFLWPFFMSDEEQSLSSNNQSRNAENSPEPIYDYCDLVAQKRAANAAKGAEWSSWFTTGFTGVGMFFLWWTLQATRETLKEAEKATVAAISATDAMYRIERPWITVTGSRISRVENLYEPGTGNLGVNWLISLNIENKGRSIARNFKNKILCLPVKNPNVIPTFCSTIINGLPRSVAPGTTISTSDVMLADGDFSKIRHGVEFLFIYIFCTYQHALSEEGTFHYEGCFRVGVMESNVDGELRITMSLTPVGPQNSEK